jgi:hypothetical protein
MAAEVRIWLLGGFRIEIETRPVPDDAWRRNKAKAVAKLPEQLLLRQEVLQLAAARLWVDVHAFPMAEPETASAWQARFAVAARDPELGRRISADKFLEGRLYDPQHAFALLEALLALGDLAAVAEFLPAARANLAGNALRAPGHGSCRPRRPGRCWGRRGRSTNGWAPPPATGPSRIGCSRWREPARR